MSNKGGIFSIKFSNGKLRVQPGAIKIAGLQIGTVTQNDANKTNAKLHKPIPDAGQKKIADATKTVVTAVKDAAKIVKEDTIGVGQNLKSNAQDLGQVIQTAAKTVSTFVAGGVAAVKAPAATPIQPIAPQHSTPAPTSPTVFVSSAPIPNDANTDPIPVVTPAPLPPGTITITQTALIAQLAQANQQGVQQALAAPPAGTVVLTQAELTAQLAVASQQAAQQALITPPVGTHVLSQAQLDAQLAQANQQGGQQALATPPVGTIVLTQAQLDAERDAARQQGITAVTPAPGMHVLTPAQLEQERQRAAQQALAAPPPGMVVVTDEQIKRAAEQARLVGVRYGREAVVNELMCKARELKEQSEGEALAVAAETQPGSTATSLAERLGQTRAVLSAAPSSPTGTTQNLDEREGWVSVEAEPDGLALILSGNIGTPAPEPANTTRSPILPHIPPTSGSASKPQ